MEEYKQALLLREQGKFDEGRALLEKAAELGYEYALRELCNMYFYGGWGVYKNVSHAMSKSMQLAQISNPRSVDDLHIAMHNGCSTAMGVLALDLLDQDENESGLRLLELSATKGSAWAYYQLSKHITCKEKREQYLVKAHAQRMCNASYDLFNLYWKEQKYKQAMDVFEQTIEIENALNTKFNNIVSCESKYFVGRSVAVLRQEPPLSQLVLDTLPYYKRLYGYVQSATITWLLIAKQLGLYKDVTRIIGKLIFASRETPTIWEKTGENKRVRIQ
jgi:tetratricopeptide (TPR) repeat protein